MPSIARRVAITLAFSVSACAEHASEEEASAETHAQVTWTKSAVTARFPSITIRGLGEEDEFWEELFDAAPSSPLAAPPAMLVEPTEEQLALVVEALERAPQALRETVANIGFANWPEGSVEAGKLGGATFGTDVVLNAALLAPREQITNERKPNMALATTHSLAHELAHTMGWLLNLISEERAGTLSERMAAVLDAYPADVRNRADLLIDQYRLGDGIYQHWNAVHNSGVQFGCTGAFGAGVPEHDAPRLGFGSSYGAQAPEEDIAEYVANAVIPAPRKPGQCSLFAGKTRLTPETAIPFAKMLLLQNLGMITPAQFTACVGNAAPQFRPGIHFDSVAATQGVRAGIATTNGVPYFRFMAGGPGAYQMMIDLRLPAPDRTPVGLHQIETVPLLFPERFAGSAIYLGHDNIDLARTGAGGAFVLVSNSATDSANGVIFDLVLENAVGLDIDDFPYATFSTH